MTLIDSIIATLAAGIKAIQTPLADPATRQVYDEIKLLLGAHYPTVDLLALERRPASLAKQHSLAEDLVDAGVLADPAMIGAVVALIDAIHSSTPATQAAQAIGVDIAQVRAASLQLRDISGDNVAVRLRDSTVAGTVEIRNAHGGSSSPKQDGNTYILTGNQADKIVFGTDDQPDFAALEQHYLLGLYVECNELSLANDGPVDVARQRQPRLQQVYVDLETTTSPTPDQVRKRFLTAGIAIDDLQNQVFALLKEQGEPFIVEELAQPAKTLRMTGPDTLQKLTQIDPGFWLRTLMRPTKLSVDELAAKLNLQPELLYKVNMPFSVVEALSSTPQLVLLGDPGGGKSTLTRRLAGLLASQAIAVRDEAETAWLAELVQVWRRWLLPVRVVLSRWAQHLAPAASGCAADLIDECVRLLSQTAEVRGLKDHVLTRLTATPPTLLILLDGLDEVADESRRATLLKAVKHFTECYSAVPLIITCRIRPWQAWTAAGSALSLPVFTIDKLNQATISAFVERWHKELVWAGRYSAAAAEAAQRRLLTALGERRRPDLADMARTPLLLTMMARVNYERGLPDSRAELYEVYLRQLLWEWERQKLDDQGQPTGLQLLLRQGNVDETSLERKLSQLAYEVHGSGAQDTVDIARSTVRDALEAIHPGRDEAKAAWAVAMLRLLNDRSGLLQSLDGATYQFSHRTFQEFLAARWLATGDFRKKYREKIDQEGWREAIALALGYQIRVLRQYEDALSVIFALFPKAATTPVEWRRVLLLGEAYVRLLGSQRASESEQAELAAQLAERLPQQLTAAMQNRDLPPAQRLAAGQLLAELDIDPSGLDDFVTAPGWTFRIGRYPVTNKQFRRFVLANGYSENRWWSPESRLYKISRGWTHPSEWNATQFNQPTQPVVGICWYEAKAYCKWLTHELHLRNQINIDEEVRLPTEAEWELVAHTYPWNNSFDINNANTKANGLGQTTFIHMYPEGVTFEGIWDMIGNIWEWTNKVDLKGIVCLKGGSWRDEVDWLSLVTRVKTPVDVRHSHVGFRCLIAKKFK